MKDICLTWTLSPQEVKNATPEGEVWRVDNWANRLAAHKDAQTHFTEWVAVAHPSDLPTLHEAVRHKFGHQDYANEWAWRPQFSLWRGAQVAHCNLENKRITMARIEDARFLSVKFMEGAWDTCEVRNIVMEHGRFVDMKLWTSDVSHAVFEGLKMRGLDMFRDTMRDSDFNACDFDEADFSECKYERVRFSACGNRDSLWREDVLQDCLFVECDFTETEFRRCDFQNVTFIRCNFAGVEFQKGSFRGCRFINCCNLDEKHVELAEEGGALFVACEMYWENEGE